MQDGPATASSVSIIRSHAINMTSRPETSFFDLGPLDILAFNDVPVDNVFVYRKPETFSEDSEFLSVERLKKAAELALDYYPHLTGRIHGYNDGRRSITRLGTGTVLLEAKCDHRIDRFTSQSGRVVMEKLPDTGDALTPPFDPSFEGFLRDPVFSIQHTRFSCGGVALGIRIHHTVADAGGFFIFVRHLAELYRGLSLSSASTLSSPPLTRRYLQRKSELSSEEVQEALNYEPRFYCIKKQDRRSIVLSPPEFPILARTLHFTEDQLRRIKRGATAPDCSGWISTFEALCAYLDQSIYRARVKFYMTKGKSEAEVANELFQGFFAPIDMRRPNRLSLTDLYFGNGGFHVYTTLGHDLLMYQPLWKIAKALHDLIRSVDANMMKMTTRWIASQPRKNEISIDFSFAPGDFTVSQWSAFDMYRGCDFEVDVQEDPVLPSLSGPPFTGITRVDGFAVVLDGRSETRSTVSERESKALDVHLTLSEPLWRYLDEDEMFSELLSEGLKAA